MITRGPQGDVEQSGTWWEAGDRAWKMRNESLVDPGGPSPAFISSPGGGKASCPHLPRVLIPFLA